MRKIIILVMSVLFLLTGSAFAGEKEDAIQLLGEIKEVGYRYELGKINYPKFSDLYTNVYVSVKKFNDKYPENIIKNQTDEILGMYKDISDMWAENINDNLSVLIVKPRYNGDNQYLWRQKIEGKYYGISSRIPNRWSNGKWFVFDVIDEIFKGYIRPAESRLETAVKLVK